MLVILKMYTMLKATIPIS